MAKTLKENERQGKTIVLKVRYSDFSTLTKRVTLDQATQDFDVIENHALLIFDSLPENLSGIRLLGVTVTGLEEEGKQTRLFD